ncbi:MAG TPA: hypothetical protein ENN51_09115 [candidate division WOR-3 bacterium]|uniref:Uncharacterized protein n=1 Tax=candidate division WOR-3 bacterium TaxID=2052148 RepID=A0A7V0T756_UNCW3|nr:hypothetical protein [candidate division WOR-3 bacterium]
MSKFELGDIVYCPDYGLELTVTKACDCKEECVITCAGTGKPLLVRKPDDTPKKPDSCCCGG